MRHASPNSNLRLKSMLLHAPVKRAAAEPELGGGERDVEMVHPKRALDHLLFELVEVQRLRRIGRDRAGRRAPRQREIVGAVAIALRHDDRALRGMAKRADVAGPVMRDQRLEHRRRKLALGLVVLALVEPQIMVEQDRNVFAPLAQRRKLDLDRVEAEQQVLPEALLVGELVLRHVGRGDHADVDRRSACSRRPARPRAARARSAAWAGGGAGGCRSRRGTSCSCPPP